MLNIKLRNSIKKKVNQILLELNWFLFDCKEFIGNLSYLLIFRKNTQNKKKKKEVDIISV